VPIQVPAGAESTGPAGDSLPRTVAIFVRHAPVVVGAFPVILIVELWFTPRAPSAQETGVPPGPDGSTVHPDVDVATLVTPEGIVSFTANPVLSFGPLLVTVISHVICPPGPTKGVAVFPTEKFVAYPGGTHWAPSLRLVDRPL
jgi:hypothetical protein